MLKYIIRKFYCYIGEKEKNKGITLITLVITVIIMLILAGVAISFIFGDNNFFDRINAASEKYTQAAQNEADYINNLLANDDINGGDISDDELRNIVNDLISRVEELENQGMGDILQAYPVGSIYLGTIETNPADLFGGTWEAYGQGRTLVGVGIGEDTRGEQLEFIINQTGGEYNHLLTVQEMPAHSHTLTAVTGTSSTRGVKSVSTGLGATYTNFLTTASSSSKTTSSVGSSAAHNNIQPYITCYMWKRIS